MHRLASRGARLAAYLADVLLVSLIPAAFFYPAYYSLVPTPPKPNLLPLELLTETERTLYETQLNAYQNGVTTVFLGSFAVFFFAFVLYQTIALLLRRGADSPRGQTFGLMAVSSRVVRSNGLPVHLGHALGRGVLGALSAIFILFFGGFFLFFLVLTALYWMRRVLYGLLSILGLLLLAWLVYLGYANAAELLGVPPEDFPPGTLWYGLAFFLILLAVYLVSLLPKRGPIDFLTGTNQIALYGDLFEEKKG